MKDTLILGDSRSVEQIKEHYAVEKQLAAKLRNASKVTRKTLYTTVYEELLIKVPHHPQNSRQHSEIESKKAVDYQLILLKDFLNKDTRFLEVGSGDCKLSLRVAEMVKEVYALEVSNEVTKNIDTVPNFQLNIIDGTKIPVASNSIDVVYSNQVMEHLHPEDALEQLENIFDVIVDGGVYVCNTPNRLSGPHDVSKYFDDEATCFHLREYTNSELSQLFYKAGFSKVTTYFGLKGKYISLPLWFVSFYEAVLTFIPSKLRKLIINRLPFLIIPPVRLVGTK